LYRSMTDKTIIFFDIDGTLLHTHSAGREAFSRTLTQVFGDDRGLEEISFAGATDLDVLEQIMLTRGTRVSREQCDTFFKCLAVSLMETIANQQTVVFPGVRELLAALSRQQQVVVGLITGNTEQGARIKVGSAGIHEHFLLGAFGCEHADRESIARLALARAQAKIGGAVAPARVFLIGDTPADITAAASIGAVSIAVATGNFNKEALRKAGADYILHDLSDTKHVLRLLGL